MKIVIFDPYMHPDMLFWRDLIKHFNGLQGIHCPKGYVIRWSAHAAIRWRPIILQKVIH